MPCPWMVILFQTTWLIVLTPPYSEIVSPAAGNGKNFFVTPSLLTGESFPDSFFG